jgi:hypothetical protein
MDNITLDLRDDGARLLLREPDGQGGTKETPVQAVSCFPWSRRNAFVSLRDEKGKELRLIEDLDRVPEAARGLVEAHLTRRLFVPRITAVRAITMDAELFRWEVETDAGPRVFVATRNDYPRSLGDGRVLVKDVGNDLYLIENPAALDARSRRLLWIYLD